MKKINREKYDAVCEAWDRYKAAPENRYLKDTPLIMKICAMLDVSYPTAVRALKEGGRK